eukprot:320560-Alexandrium_andersonii.AAC.1
MSLRLGRRHELWGKGSARCRRGTCLPFDCNLGSASAAPPASGRRKGGPSSTTPDPPCSSRVVATATAK